MRIVILGAGTVGSSIARMLSQNRHDVVIVEQDSQICESLQDTIDALVLCGSASHASVLFQAGVMTADLCLAVTSSDDTNITSTSIAKAMGASHVIARIHSELAKNIATFDYRRHFGIDKLFSLGQFVALRLSREIDYFTEALSLDSYFYSDIEIMEMRILHGARCLGKPIRDLAFPPNVRVGAILRDDTRFIPTADDELQVNDAVLIIGARDKLVKVRKDLGGLAPSSKNVVIAGGGETGVQLAMLIQNRHEVRILDADRERCMKLSSQLKNVDVLNVDIQKRATLEEEHVGKADVFVACSGSDENNILACAEAKELGCPKVFSVINRPDYGNVLNKLGIDFYVSPREEAAERVMNFLNTGAVITDDAIFGNKIRMLEIEVQENAPILAGTLAEAKLPQQCVVLAVADQDSFQVPSAQQRFQPGNHVIVITQEQFKDSVIEKFEKHA